MSDKTTDKHRLVLASSPFMCCQLCLKCFCPQFLINELSSILQNPLRYHFIYEHFPVLEPAIFEVLSKWAMSFIIHAECTMGEHLGISSFSYLSPSTSSLILSPPYSTLVPI